MRCLQCHCHVQVSAEAIVRPDFNAIQNFWFTDELEAGLDYDDSGGSHPLSEKPGGPPVQMLHSCKALLWRGCKGVRCLGACEACQSQAGHDRSYQKEGASFAAPHAAVLICMWSITMQLNSADVTKLGQQPVREGWLAAWPTM